VEYCPGARAIRQPKPEIFTCPGCGEEIEIWTDEISGACARCGEVMYREGTMSCLEWCAYAKECVGGAAYDRFLSGKTAGVKRRLLQVLERRLAGSPEELDRVSARLQEVERAAARLGAEGFIVIPAALVLLGLPGGDLEKTLVSAGLSVDHARRVRDLVSRFRREREGGVLGPRRPGPPEPPGRETNATEARGRPAGSPDSRAQARNLRALRDALPR